MKNVQDLDYIDAISIRLLEISTNKAEFKKELNIKILNQFQKLKMTVLKLMKKSFLKL